MGIRHFIKYFPDFVLITIRGDFIGDAVILKSTFGRFEPSFEVKDFISGRRHLFPDYSDIEFKSFQPGTFGHAYHQFMKDRKLSPFRFSGSYADLLEKNYLPIFYASVHDFFHVLTGYDTTFAGEAGVWAFVAAQNISPQAMKAHRMAQLFFPVISPLKTSLIRQAGREGLKMGKSASQILTMDFRKELEKPLEEVRSRYAIKPTMIKEIEISQ